MKNVLLITSSPTVGGNGDAIIDAARTVMEKAGCSITRIDIRDKEIEPCKACFGCAVDGVCVQSDDMAEVIDALHDADVIIAEAPVYYNCMAAQALTPINRLFSTYAYKAYKIGPKKRVGIMLTCGGSSPEELKAHVRGILDLPSLSRSISAYRVEVFPGCGSSSTCSESKAYMDTAAELASWSLK